MPRTKESGVRMRVVCDTPLGVESAEMEAAGKGLIVTERLVEKFADARGWQPEDCELILVTEEPSGRIMWQQERPE